MTHGKWGDRGKQEVGAAKRRPLKLLVEAKAGQTGRAQVHFRVRPGQRPGTAIAYMVLVVGIAEYDLGTWQLDGLLSVEQCQRMRARLVALITGGERDAVQQALQMIDSELRATGAVERSRVLVVD